MFSFNWRSRWIRVSRFSRNSYSHHRGIPNPLSRRPHNPPRWMYVPGPEGAIFRTLRWLRWGLSAVWPVPQPAVMAAPGNPLSCCLLAPAVAVASAAPLATAAPLAPGSPPVVASIGAWAAPLATAAAPARRRYRGLAYCHPHHFPTTKPAISATT